MRQVMLRMPDNHIYCLCQGHIYLPKWVIIGFLQV